MKQKYALIAQNRSVFPVGAMSKLFNVSRSGFYDWLKRKESKRSASDRELTGMIAKVFRRSQCRYGRPKIQQDLIGLGIRAGDYRVWRLMKNAGIKPISQRRFKVQTTDCRHTLPVSVNLLRQNFKTPGPNRVWFSDITYIRTRRGWLHLCNHRGPLLAADCRLGAAASHANEPCRGRPGKGGRCPPRGTMAADSSFGSRR